MPALKCSRDLSAGADTLAHDGFIAGQFKNLAGIHLLIDHTVRSDLQELSAGHDDGVILLQRAQDLSDDHAAAAAGSRFCW